MVNFSRVDKRWLVAGGRWLVAARGVDWTGIGVYPGDCLPIKTFLGLSGSVGWNFEGVAGRIWIGFPGDCFGIGCLEGGAEGQRTDTTGRPRRAYNKKRWPHCGHLDSYLDFENISRTRLRRRSGRHALHDGRPWRAPQCPRRCLQAARYPRPLQHRHTPHSRCLHGRRYAPRPFQQSSPITQQ